MRFFCSFFSILWRNFVESSSECNYEKTREREREREHDEIDLIHDEIVDVDVQVFHHLTRSFYTTIANSRKRGRGFGGATLDDCTADQLMKR